MNLDAFGPPQIAALLILAQRGLEELYSQWNTRRLLAAGGHESGADFYPVVAVTHLAWIASIGLLIPAASPIVWPALGLFLVLQPIRYWVIATLGRNWTHRIIVVPGAPMVRRGIYRVIRHPNYVVTIAETFLLPLAFGAWALAIIMTAVWGAVVLYKLRLEDAANAGRPDPA